MAQKKNRTAIGIVSVVIAVLLIAGAVGLFLWSRGRNASGADDTGDTAAASDISANPLVNTDTSDLPDDTAAEPAADTTAPEPVPELEIETVTASDSAEVGGETATIKMDYPRVKSAEYGENVDKFNELVITETENFKNSFALAVAGDGDNPGRAVNYKLTYKVYKNSYGVVSVLFDENKDGNVTHRSVNFEFNGGSRVTLDSIVVAGREVYEPAIKSLILDQMKAAPEKYKSTADNALDGLFNMEQFLMTDSGIVIFFQDGEITSNGGYAEFELKYADLRTLMAY